MEGTIINILSPIAMIMSSALFPLLSFATIMMIVIFAIFFSFLPMIRGMRVLVVMAMKILSL